MCSRSVTRRFPVTASNSGHSSCLRAQVLSEMRFPANCLIPYNWFATISYQPYSCLHRPAFNWTLNSSNDSESYVTTDGKSFSLSWCQAPIWGLRPDFYHYQTIARLLMWVALSEAKTGLSLLQTVPVMISRPWSRRKHRFQLFLYCCTHACCRGNVFAEPFLSNGSLFMLIKSLLPSNGSCSLVCFVSVA
jgi:hypothetical protein